MLSIDAETGRKPALTDMIGTSAMGDTGGVSLIDNRPNREDGELVNYTRELTNNIMLHVTVQVQDTGSEPSGRLSVILPFSGAREPLFVHVRRL